LYLDIFVVTNSKPLFEIIQRKPVMNESLKIITPTIQKSIIPIKANSGTGASPQFALPALDNEYLPLFAVQPQYPRRAQERGTEGFAIISFTITEQGTAENAIVIEGKCGDINNPEVVMRDCSIFNNSSLRAAAKLKYKPKIVDGNPVKVDGVAYRFRYEMEEDD